MADTREISAPGPRGERPHGLHPSGAAVGHLGFLEGVRGLAALYVVLHHIWITNYPQFPENTGPAWASWMMWGHLAVAVFIVVSGFSLALSPQRHGDHLPDGFVTYLRRRAFRIIPPYWVALLISILVIVLFTGTDTHQTVDLKSVLVFGTLMQDVVGAPSPTGRSGPSPSSGRSTSCSPSSCCSGGSGRPSPWGSSLPSWSPSR